MMEVLQSPTPFYAIVISLLAIPLIGLSRGKPNLRESWTIVASLVKFFLVLSMIPAILEGRVIEFTLGSILPGLEVSFRVDSMGLLFALTASFLWILTSVYSIGYMRASKGHHQTRYYAYFAVALSATMGIAFSSNLFTLFLFYEFLTLSTYPLVIHDQTAESLKAGRKYLTYLLGTSFLFLLSAIFITYHAVGTLNFSPQGLFKAAPASGFLLGILCLVFIAGTTKAALIPLHSWLPTAMVAPTPVSALLHAVAVVKAGVFTILRILYDVFGVDLLGAIGLGTLLVYLSSLTILAASVAALRQDNLKLRLAYSTISQLAYVVFGAALLSTGGIAGSLFQIITHAFGKITLFFCAGAIYIAAHKTRVSELDGIGLRMPLTMAAFSVGALSMIGVPLVGGFIPKWYLMIGSIQAGQMFGIFVLMASTILNACYFLPIVYAAFLKDPPRGQKVGIQEAPISMVAPILLTAAGTVALFFVPAFIEDLVGISVETAGGKP